MHHDADSYDESGAGGANLHVDRQHEDLLNLGIGGRAEWLLHPVNGIQVKPDIHAGYQYDVLNNDRVNTDSSFAAGGCDLFDPRPQPVQRDVRCRGGHKSL